MIEPVVAQRLEILQRFFDVLLSDIAFARYDEAMAVAYVQYDRAKARQELGDYSDLQVAELDATYHDLRRRRMASGLAQRLTRMLLAEAIARPAHIPRDLVAAPLPKPPSNELPDLDESVAGAMQGNPWLPSLKAAADQDQRRLEEMALRQQVQELFLRLEGLKSAEQYAGVESFRSDLKLDEARVQYELEFKADLGFSMSQQTLSRLREQRIAYCQALAGAELNALQGKPVWPGMDMVGQE